MKRKFEKRKGEYIMCRINGLKLEMIRKAAKMSQKALAKRAWCGS